MDRRPCFGFPLSPSQRFLSPSAPALCPRIIAIKKSPTFSVRLYSGNISTPGTFCSLSHSLGTLPWANQQSAGLLVPALRCRLTSCGARIGRRPLGRGLSSATAAPAPAPCFRRRRRSPSQLLSSSERATKIKAPTAGHANLYPRYILLIFPFPGTLPRANQQSAGLLVPALRCRLTSCGARIGRRPLERGLSSATAAPALASLFPPQAAVAFAAVLVPDGAPALLPGL